jgi:hypothetical protein
VYRYAAGEAVVVVESDKADMDVETFYDGYLAYIVVPDGEMAVVGAPIAYVAETEGEIEQAKAMAAAAGSAAPAPAAPAPVAEAAPAAAPPAPAEAAPAAPVAAAPAPAAAAPVAGRADGRIIATPYAKKLAKKLKVDLATIAGTGLNGGALQVEFSYAERFTRRTVYTQNGLHAERFTHRTVYEQNGTESLKAPGFTTLEPIKCFPGFKVCFRMGQLGPLHDGRISAGDVEAKAGVPVSADYNAPKVGRCKLNPVDPQLETARPQPLNLSNDMLAVRLVQLVSRLGAIDPVCPLLLLVSSLCFFKRNLCRYTKAAPVAAAAAAPAGPSPSSAAPAPLPAVAGTAVVGLYKFNPLYP